MTHPQTSTGVSYADGDLGRAVELLVQQDIRAVHITKNDAKSVIITVDWPRPDTFHFQISAADESI